MGRSTFCGPCLRVLSPEPFPWTFQGTAFATTPDCTIPRQPRTSTNLLLLVVSILKFETFDVSELAFSSDAHTPCFVSEPILERVVLEAFDSNLFTQL